MPPAPQAKSPGILQGGVSGASASSIPERTLGETKIPYEVLRYIPEESAEHYRFAPLGVVEGALEVGMVDPDNIAGVDALNFIARKTGMPFKIFRIVDADLQKVIAMYRGLGGDVDRALSDLESEEKKSGRKKSICAKSPNGE